MFSGISHRVCSGALFKNIISTKRKVGGEEKRGAQAVQGGCGCEPPPPHCTRPARCSTVCGLGHQETNCQRGRSPIPERGGKLRAASLRPSSVPFASVLYQVANGLRVRDQSASVSPWVSIPSYRTSVGIGREGLPLGHLLGPVTACCPKRQFLHPQH